MNDSAPLLSSLALKPGDWSIRLKAAEALVDEGRPADALALLKQTVETPISLVDSRRVADLVKKLEADGVVPTAPAEAANEEEEPVAVAVAVIDDEDDDGEPVLMAAAVAEDAGAYGAYGAEGGAGGGHEDDGEHHGDLVFLVAEGEAVKPHEKESDAAAKISALTAAIFVHVAIAVILGLVVIAMPRPAPPQVTATLSQTDADQVVDEVKIQKITRAVSSSSAQSSPVVSVMAASPVAIPEFDSQAQTFDVTLGAVSANIGVGMSFEAAEEESMVNFFGIRSKGSRIVLVIEAARFMLTDTKGGIPAYDKVKEDIAKMLGGLNKTTAFNIVLFEGKKLASFREELVPASPSNVRQAIEWLDPINKVYEELGIREGYTTAPIQEGVDPIPVNDLTHYVKALQRTMEMDVSTVFLLTSGWIHHGKPLDERELAKFYRDYKWTEKDEAAWVAAVQRAQAWLEKENAARREKGVPQRVIRDWHEIVREMEPNLRRKPGPGYTMEEVEAQVNNAKNFYYRAANKKRPEINVVWFIGTDEEPGVTVDSHFKSLTRRDGGKMRVLQGLEQLKNVTRDPR